MNYVCPNRHVTITPRELKWTRCRFHFGDSGSTHYPGCAEYHECGLRAIPIDS